MAGGTSEAKLHLEAHFVLIVLIVLKHFPKFLNDAHIVSDNILTVQIFRQILL